MPTWKRSHLDTFNRSDSGTVGNGWVVGGGSTGFAIVGNRLNVTDDVDITAGKCLYRPYLTSPANPASLVPGTNEGSANQRVVFQVRNADQMNSLSVDLRANSAGDRCYSLFSNSGRLYVRPVVGGSMDEISGGNAIHCFELAQDVSHAMQVDFSAVSTSGSNTLLTLTVYDLIANAVLYTGTLNDTKAGLQSADVASGSTVKISGFAGANTSSFLDQIEIYTDQDVSYSSPLVAGTVSAGTPTANAVTLTGAAPTGGATAYSYRWFRSTSAPSGGNYGQVLPGRTALSFKDHGLRCATGYYYTLESTDSSAYSPQVVYSTPVLVTTAAGSTDNPGSVSSLKFWMDARELTGQTGGQPLSGPFGPFQPSHGLVGGTGPFTPSLTPPVYTASALPNGEPALTFAGGQYLSILPGECAELDAAFAGSFTYTVVFNLTERNSDTLAMMYKGTRIAPWTVGNRVVNADSFGYTNRLDAMEVAPKTAAPGSPIFAMEYPVAIFQVSYNASTHLTTICEPNGTFREYAGNPTIEALGYRFPTALGVFVDFQYNDVLFPFAGQISQVLVHDAALTRTQMRAIQGYFRGRFQTEPTDLIARIICVGDSRTEGADGSGWPGTSPTAGSGGIAITVNTWPHQLQALLGSRYYVKNTGEARIRTDYFTDPTTYGYARLLQATNVIMNDPAVPQIGIVAPIGVNDFGHDDDPAVSAANYIDLVEYIEAFNDADHAYAWKVIWSTEMDANFGPSYPESDWLPYRLSMMNLVRAAIPAIEGERAMADLMVDDLIGDPGTYSNPVYFSDELHLTGQNSAGVVGGGYGVMASYYPDLIADLVGTGGDMPATGVSLAIDAATTVGVQVKLFAVLTGGAPLDTDAVIAPACTGATFSPTTITIPAGSSFASCGVTFGTTGSKTVTGSASGGASGFTVASASTTVAAAGVYPTAAQVVASVVFGPTSNLTGNLVLPTANQVISTATFGVSGGTSGTVVQAPANKVELGYAYGPGGATTGTLSVSGGGSIDYDLVQDSVTAALTAFGKTGYKLAADGVDAIVVESGINLRQAQSPILAASAGKVSGAGTGSVTVKGAGNTTTRIVATTDGAGNRSAVTLTLPT